MKKYAIVLFLVGLAAFFVPSWTFADSELGTYKEGLNFLKQGKNEVALLRFYRIVTDAPGSPYAEKSQFQIVEYFYNGKQYGQLETETAKYYALFPHGENIDRVNVINKESQLRLLHKKAQIAEVQSDWGNCASALKEVLVLSPQDAGSQDRLVQCEQKDQLQKAKAKAAALPSENKEFHSRIRK